MRPAVRQSRSSAVNRAVLALLAVAGIAAADTNAAAPPARVVAIADVHGDATTFRTVLRQAGIIDDQGRWSGGQTTLVQTGDYVDRGTEVRAVLDLLMSLQAEAAAAGGNVIVLLGNHEALNLVGEVRDVAPEVFASFADAQSDARRQQAFEAYSTLAESRRKALSRARPPIEAPPIYAAPEREGWMAAHPAGFLEYLDAIAPSGRYGAWLRQRPATVRVGGTVFVHGGFDPEVGPKSLDALNDQVSKEIRRFDEMRKYMIDRQLALPSFTFRELLDAARTELARVAVEARAEGTDPVIPGALPPAVMRHPLAGLLDIDSWALVNPRGPLWFRGFATWTDAEGEAAIASLTKRYEADRFVVGHSITKTERITPRFENRVFLIDTGMSSVYRPIGGQGSALEIQGETITAIYATERVELTAPALGR